ncbi:MAG: Rrf2 family transcriptional regulator [Calditrichaceae bacterium]|nr:Rrf2 family transcriptional regulator [Calditrichaceae bacterium]MBN2707624.1 Rrf2 family transcriptional regulator [Calditrichaceae bacterium]RQV93204.1 MAG: transcriptional regulator [Calditrichota bacterium]
MAASSKLSTSVKALCFLGKHQQKGWSSAEISKEIGINTSKLRRLLSMLVKSGILKSSRGKEGKFVLNKPPDKIHLQEVYCAIEDRKAFHLDVRHVSVKDLPDSAKLNNYFLDLFAEIQIDIEDKMRKISIKNIIEQIL